MRTAVGLVVVFIACAVPASAQRASSGASPVIDARYVTFFVVQGNSSGSPTVDRQLKADIEMELTDRGFVETSPDEAEAVVIVHEATPAKHSRGALYDGWGGWGWRIADTRAPNAADDYKAGTLVVDVFDAWTKELVWHGSAPNGVSNSSDANTHVTKHGAARIFKNFPYAGSQAGSRGFDDTEFPRASDQGMRIVFSPAPALLVRIDGEPRYEPVIGTELQRVINTTALIVRDVVGIHYFRRGDTWMEAYDLTGSWSTAGTVPEGAEVALRQARSDKRTDLFSSAQSQSPMPAVFVSTTPAELIVTDGEPRYGPFNGTALLYIRNTTATVFREPTDQELYVRVPTGWFRAWTTNGPWEPVRNDKLPADLAGVRN